MPFERECVNICENDEPWNKRISRDFIYISLQSLLLFGYPNALVIFFM